MNPAGQRGRLRAPCLTPVNSSETILTRTQRFSRILSPCPTSSSPPVLLSGPRCWAALRFRSASAQRRSTKRPSGPRSRGIADALAEAKAQRVGVKEPAALTLGCDQILDLDGTVFSKPESREQAADQLSRLSGKTHRLRSAAVIYHDVQPVWRFVGEVRMTMRPLSPAYVSDYLDRNWPEVGSSVGAYRIEEEGSRLFSRIDGDYFSILGLPLLPLLTFLQDREVIRT